jgi:2-isopropylmalate synthase
MERKLALTPDEVLERVRWSVAYAAELADEVEFSAEDATRSDRVFLAEVCSAAVAAGATIVNLPDTVGYSSPVEYAGLFQELVERCPELTRVELSVHCHNDLGLAVANSLAGVGAGATQVECTVNGIGERAGNASLEEIAMAIRVRADAFEAETAIDPAVIRDASALVCELTGYPVALNKPIVGANAFAHEAGIHQDGMLKDAGTYQIIDPRELGTAMTLPLGKHSGRHAFALACAEAGHALERSQLDSAFRRFKELADLGQPVSLDQVFQEVPA